ncbi:DUF58 domain-containing protein [Chengkuizengella axinellae]|uniref:DUF58 domain-containing protein n=1 Tax=Chengkuizengella axinellae TaxID=3064388 RepID=A0ABT9IXV5_9BACL|nr:DUF58 domain-containing protein [Chengkuizengella sp. 2205SS18-9]MDP5274152.1 DUF58 domain-containing protein [Chengkuizengella sp. 2205SS18-9]
MMWRREVHIPEIFRRAIYVIPILFLLEYLLFSSFILIFTILLFISIYAFIYYYLHHIQNDIHLMNRKKTVKLFPGETAKIPINIKHRGIIPFLQGEIFFQSSNTIHCTNVNKLLEDDMKSNYRFSISHQFNSEKVYPVDIVAKKRGIAKFQNIELKALDPFFIGFSLLFYQSYFRTEVLVYPEPKLVANAHFLEKMKGGDHITRHSLFEDTSLIRGAREYAPNDPFSRIHWGLSAKNNRLMTKEFDNTNYVKWTFVLNVLVDHPQSVNNFSLNMENDICYITYMCQYAHKHNIPFEMYANVVMNNTQSAFHLEQGKGQTHLLKAMEMLARITTGSITIKPNHFYASLKKRVDEDAIMIYFGDHGKTTEEFLLSWLKTGTTIFTVEKQEEVAHILPFETRRGSVV